MVYLPSEIIHAIIHEYRQARGNCSLIPLACINRNWQTVAEHYRWSYLRIYPQNLGQFRSVFRGNSGRKRSLKTLDIRFEDYFAKEDQNMKEEDSGDEGSTDDGSSGEPDDAFQSRNYDSEDCGKNRGITSDRDCQVEDGERQTPLMRLTAFQNEHARFFREIKPIWDELASWKNDLQITNISFHMKGYSIYDFVGSDVCGGEYFGDSTLLDFVSFPALPLLPSVKHLWVREDTNREMDLWPAIVTYSVASSLPMLERLEAVSIEYDPRWPLIRKYLRQALANQIWNLPTSLRTLYLCLEHDGIQNHRVQPPNFLVGGLDCLSRSIHHISTHLTTLARRLSYISAALFWDPNVPSANSYATTWPNLRILDISTGLERSTGDYWLRSAVGHPDHEPLDYPGPEHPDSDRFRTRPEPRFFNELAISIARAAACMPKLEYLDLEFNASHQGLLDSDTRSFHQGLRRNGGFNPDVHQYEGWAFYYRASNEARFASKYTKLYWFEHEPGLDRTEIEHPRTEWVFQCPHGQVQWEEPEAAKMLWREKCPQIDSDFVTLDDGGESWERRRNGDLIPLLGARFMTKFPGRPDLSEIPRARG